MDRVGIIAGAGQFPLLLARQLRLQGLETVAVALEEEADAALEAEVDRTHWQPVGRVGRLLKVLRKESVRHAILAGKVQKTRIFRDFRPDLRALTLLWGLRDRRDDTILSKVAEVLASEGIELLPQTFAMEPYLPAPQVFTRRQPTADERADIDFGAALAREVGRLDVGQTVVVKSCAVLAVEAIEGTDAAIRRGGTLGGPGAVAVKVAKPQQDPRFDVPAVGLETVRACSDAGVRVLAFEARKTFFFQQERALEEAERHGIAVLAF